MLEQLAERRYGLVTKAEALDFGMSPRTIKHRVESGRWRVIRRNVYAINGCPVSWEQEMCAVVLSAGEGVLASHASGVRLWNVPLDADTHEVLAPLGRHVRMAGVKAHRTGLLIPDDITVRGLVPCTTPSRTIADLSGRLDATELGRLADNLLRRRLLRLGELARVAGRLHVIAPGRSPQTLATVLEARGQGFAPGDSDLEARYLLALMKAGAPMPRTQYWVRLHGKRYRVDLAYPEQRVAIEIDSWAYHRWRSAFDGDRARRNDLVLDGWRVLQISDGMPPEEMVALTLAALERLVTSVPHTGRK
jgi:hypothetical protein